MHFLNERQNTTAMQTAKPKIVHCLAINWLCRY